MSQLTPLDVCKLFGVAAVAIAAVKRNLVFNPFFWIYFSWTWLFWPWFVAVAGGVYGIYCYRKYSRGKASKFEQLAIVTSAFTWLTLVPPAYFNGLLEGWPFVFFFVYHYFSSSMLAFENGFISISIQGHMILSGMSVCPIGIGPCFLLEL